ncbi:MAG: hypothetical protein QI199_03765 [Candidatus Korarchaeota archaeon]|nr:hypothetical protein [Candidatus Korarchaeota archaeon]
MSIVELDEKGRITIPKRMRGSLEEERVLLISLGNRIEIVPIPEESFQSAQGIFQH